MTDTRSNLGPSSTRRRLATVIAMIGIIFVAERLVSRWPRNVEVAYEVTPDVSELDVDYLYREGAVASARFRRLEAKTTIFRHVVRLQPGEYRVLLTLYRPEEAAVEEDKVLVVPAEGVTRFDLRDITQPE